MKIEEQERAKYDDVAPDVRGGVLRLESGGRGSRDKRRHHFLFRTGRLYAHRLGTADLCQYSYLGT
jgi:hypothetical protein